MYFEVLSTEHYFHNSKTGISSADVLATLHFLYFKLVSFSDMEYYYYQLAYRNLKVSKHFVGLSQMQGSPFWQQLQPTKRPHYMLAQHKVFRQEKCLSYPQDCVCGEDCAHSGTSPLYPPILYI